MSAMKEVKIDDGQIRFEEISMLLLESSRRRDEINRLAKTAIKEIEKPGLKLWRLNRRHCKMSELMDASDILDRFCELGFKFTKAYHSAIIMDEVNQIFTEVDVTLEDDEKALIIVVEPEPAIRDVREHFERIQKVKRYAVLHGDMRKQTGAVAGMTFNKRTRDFVLSNGLYLIEPSEETIKITMPECPVREWAF